MKTEKTLKLIKRFPEQDSKSSQISFRLPHKSNKADIDPEEKEVEWSLNIPSRGNDFDISSMNYVIHRAFVNQRYNERSGTAKTLTRAEVRGGGRKPWRQKGTGRARAGSNRSPLWKGGGVSFGPRPKIYKHKINRKEWQLSLRALLLQKRNQILLIDQSELTSLESKTSSIKKVFHQFDIDITQKTVIITPQNDANLSKITRNIKTLQLLNANNLNLKVILYSKQLLITRDSLKIIDQIYNT